MPLDFGWLVLLVLPALLVLPPPVLSSTSCLVCSRPAIRVVWGLYSYEREFWTYFGVNEGGLNETIGRNCSNYVFKSPTPRTSVFTYVRDSRT